MQPGDPNPVVDPQCRCPLHERTLDDDIAYGFRLLVDIAERSLSDSPFEDPSTAVQAIDRLHDCLRHLVRRPFPTGAYEDEEGVVRLVVPTMGWPGYVRLAFSEIRLCGASSPQVVRRLEAALEDLRAIAPEDRRAVLEEELALLREAAEAGTPPGGDARFAMRADGQGIGVAASEG